MKRFKKSPAYQGKHLVLHVSGGDRTIQDNEVLEGGFWAKFVAMGFLVPVTEEPVAAAAPAPPPPPPPVPKKKEPAPKPKKELEPESEPKEEPAPVPEPEPEPEPEPKEEPVPEGQGTRSTAEKMATMLKKTGARKRRK